MTKLEKHATKKKQPEPDFLDKKWYLSTNKIWHKVEKGHLVCIRAVGKVKAGSFDLDQSDNKSTKNKRKCVHCGYSYGTTAHRVICTENYMWKK